MASVVTKDVVAGGVRSRVRESGAGKGEREAVVFVHGNPGSSEDWTDLLGRVGEFAHAVAPDMPGFGKAERPVDFDYTIAGYGRHLAGVLEQMGIDRVHLVLHDFGGAWGLEWAVNHPTQVASATLVNMGILPGYTWHKAARIWRTPILGELATLLMTRGAFKKSLNDSNPKPFPPAFIDRMYDDFDSGTKRAVLRLYRATSDLAALSRASGEKLKPLQLPALVVWGKEDAYVPSRFAEAQRDYFKDPEIHVIPGCGHWPFVDEPEKVAALLVPFLEARLGARSQTAGGPHAS
jgi:pimeloyl-ACP methyl ester carboxylesterase